jgi:hypothetical protein
MLKFFSRMEKTRNFLLLLFAVVMVLSLIVAGSLMRDNASVSTSIGSTETAAKVGGEKVTVGELAALKQGRAGSLPSKYLINSLVGQRIIRIEADRLGLRASDAEVANEIRKQLKTEDGTVIDQKRYEENVARDYGSADHKTDRPGADGVFREKQSELLHQRAAEKNPLRLFKHDEGRRKNSAGR